MDLNAASFPKPQCIALLIPLLSLAAPAAHAQINASDNCGFLPGNEYAVDPDCLPRPFQLPPAFSPSAATSPCAPAGLADAFGWITGTGNAISVDYAPNNTSDLVIDVYSGSCGALTHVACANDYWAGGSEHLEFASVAGQQYLIRISSVVPGEFMPDGVICIRPTPPPPPNDHPCQATFLDPAQNCTAAVSSSYVSATPTPGVPDPGCYFAGQADLWYSTRVPPGGNILVDSYTSGDYGPGDCGMAIYEADACDQPMTLIDCNDDQALDDHMPAISRSGLTPGDTVYIRFWSYYAREGDFLICASPNTSTLPVKLISFTAEASAAGVNLHWATASEQNSDRFEVERSADGSEFLAIGSLPAAGQSSAVRSYSFLDPAPALGINYYRLVQRDMDGSTDTSFTVPCRAGHASPDLLFPNPVAAELTIQLAQDMPAGATLWVNGVVDRSLVPIAVDRPLRAGTFLPVDVSGLPPGTYFLSMELPSGATRPMGLFLKH